MKNETSEEASKPVANNSSLMTAENSSSIQSKLNNRRKKLALLNKKKYSNTALFENKKRELSLKEKEKESKKQKNSIYITDVTSSKFRDTNFETKSTLHTTKNNQTYNSIKSRTKHSFSRTANINTNKNRNSSLPYITNYNPRTDEKNFLTYFGNIFTKDYVKNIYKEKIEPKKESNENINLNKKKNKTFRDDKNEYIRKTNEIKRLKYELDLKKHALEDFKFKLMNKINSFEKTNADILAYKEDIENNFISRYNDNLRKLSRKLYDLKIELDIQNNKLKGLKNDINNLKQSIVKKENCLKDIEKWLKLQIFIKEGKNPTDLKTALIKYKGKLIFNSMEELEGHINYKQSQNLRLIQKYNKIEKEKEKLFPWLEDQEKSFHNLENIFINNITEKLIILNSLKKREKNLLATINQLKKENISNKDENDNKNKKENTETKIALNELGVKYKPILYKNNIYHYIDCIFCGILANNIQGISLDTKDSNQLYNVNIQKEKKALIQMNFIEISLNYLISTINKKIANDKNSVIIIEKTTKLIESYHKMLNVNRNKMEMKKKRDKILKKVQDRSNKNYVFYRGKTDYNVVKEQKNINIEKMKNKKKLKNIDIWDFFYDVQ
jgi:hypothetical protein